MLANSHTFNHFDDSENFPWGLSFIDSAVMLHLEHLGMTMYIHTYIYGQIDIPPLHFNQPSDGFILIIY